jgi:two-component system, NarL family, response regulator NreC
MQGNRRPRRKTASIERSKKTHLLIVGDQTVIREALKSLLVSQPEVYVIGAASSHTLELPAIGPAKPEVILLDLPINSSGLSAISNLRRAFPDPDTRILILSSVEEPFNVDRLIKAGAGGVVFTRIEVSELLLAIKTVAKGEIYLDRAIMSRVVMQKDPERKPRTLDLSERERQVLTLIASGYTHKDIGERLRISVKTVETYRYRLVEKLGLRSRADLVKYALANGLLRLQTLALLFASYLQDLP